jgi:hypothetical protein
MVKMNQSLKRNWTAKLAVALALVLAASVSAQRGAQQQASVTVYKTATCGCCSKWVDHLRAQGFDVKALDVDNIASVKATYGVPQELGSCHTALVGGYVVEGHVPGDVVSRMLRERPKIVGLAVPGMPVGSPGMEVPGRSESYSILSFDKTGKSAVYDRR